MRYQHYKGGHYQDVCCAALESNSALSMMVYEGAGDAIWARPEREFFGEVDVDGVKVPRFNKVDTIISEHRLLMSAVQRPYRHYKGDIYYLVCEAQLEVDETLMIVYRSATGSIWMRPKEEFFAPVEIRGTWVPRFTPAG